MDFSPRILVTAGPTHEPIDAVRYLANRSSGRMGLALTQAAVHRGWPTTLLLGPTALIAPESSHLKTIRFQTTADLQQLLRQEWPNHDVLFMAAAVADFRPVAPMNDDKITRGKSPLNLQLEPTPDLLAELSQTTRSNQTLIGFALEPHDRLLASARDKLSRKTLAAIVANPIETMDSTTVHGTLLLRDGRSIDPPAGRMTKEDFAQWLMEHVGTIAECKSAPLAARS